MNISETNIHGIFPTPVYRTKIDRPLTKQELQFVDNQKEHCVQNTGNVNTKDNYILNNKEFKDIKYFIEQCCKDYLEKIISPKNKIQLYVTQSWLNYTEENEYHHKHAHPNSLVSGVFYLNGDKEFDKIEFYRDEYEMIKPEVETWNLFNSQSWWFPVQTGDIIMFPSSLIHMVEMKKGSNTRTSLAFNTFIKGTFGENGKLNELQL